MQLENYLHSSILSSKKKDILKDKQKNKWLCIHKINRYEIKMKMKNRSHRYNLNRLRSRHELKYNKYKNCLSMMLICIKHHTPKQHLKLSSGRG